MGGRAGWGGMGRRGGVEWGGVGEVGGGKNHPLGQPRNSHGATQWPITHQWTTQPVRANTGPPLSNWHPPLVPLFQP